MAYNSVVRACVVPATLASVFPPFPFLLSMASVIPGPYAKSDAELVPARYGAGSDTTRDFFLKLIPALQEEPVNAEILKATGNFGRLKSDWTLSDMNEGVVKIMMSNVQQVLNAAAEEDWYFAVCPRKEGAPALNYQVTSVFFRPEISQEAAPRTLPRNMDIEQTAGQYGLTRMINGFQVDTETTLAGVERGMEWFLERVAMMQVGIIETDKFTIISGIMNMHRVQRVRWDDLLDLAGKRGGVRDWIIWENNMALSICKRDDPVRFWRDASETDFQFLGVPTNGLVTILHDHSARALVPNDFYRNKSRGDQQAFMDKRGAVADVLGAAVNFTRNFRGGKGQTLNPVGQVFPMGLYHAMVDPADECPSEPYATEYRRIKITNAEDSGMMVLDPLDVMIRSGRWDPVTGELLSLVDSAAWAVASEDQKKRIGGAAASDALHVSIAKTLFGPDEDQAYVGPAQYWGSVKTSSISTKKLLSCAKTVIANMGTDLAASVEDAIGEYLSLVSEAGIAPLNNGNDLSDVLAAAAAAESERRSEASPGCQSSNPTLEFTKTDPSTRFTSGFTLANITSMPAGMTSLGAMRYLAGIPTIGAALKKRLDKVVDGADALARALKSKFSTSVMMDPNYAPTDMEFANHADMLFTSGVLPRRAVVIVMKDAAGGTAAAAVGSIYTNAENWFRDTGSENVVANYNPAGKGTAEAVKAGIVLTALRNFAKARAGNFVADPSILANMNLGNAAQTPQAFGEEVLVKLRSASRPAEAYTRKSGDLKQAFTDLIDGITAAADGTQKPVMTKLLLEPQQVARLHELRTDPRTSNAFAAITVGKDGRQDIPASSEDLKAYADGINGRSAAVPYFGAPLQLNGPLLGPGSLGALASVGQLRTYLAESGYPVARRVGQARGTAGSSLRPAPMQTLGTSSSRRAKLLDLLKSSGSAAAAVAGGGGAAAAADPSGTVRKYFGCIDSDLDLMFTDGFVEHWDEANAGASSHLELLIARLYMTTPTNFKKSIQMWATNNVRIPLNFVVLREARIRTYPVVRMVPGEGTNFLAVGFKSTRRGTDQATGIFGINHSYYTGYIPVEPKNVQIYHNVDPAGYVSGLGSAWANFAKGTPGMVSMFMPGDRLPIALSPFGSIGVESEKSQLEEYDAGTGSTSVFEQYRQGKMNTTWPVERHPHNPWGVPVDSALKRHFSRDTTLFAGPKCDYVKHVPSASPIPTEFATGDLRAILDGSRLRPADPLMLGANNQLPVSV